MKKEIHKYKKNLSNCFFIRHKFRVDRCGLNSGFVFDVNCHFKLRSNLWTGFLTACFQLPNSHSISYVRHTVGVYIYIHTYIHTYVVYTYIYIYTYIYNAHNVGVCMYVYFFNINFISQHVPLQKQYYMLGIVYI